MFPLSSCSHSQPGPSYTYDSGSSYALYDASSYYSGGAPSAPRAPPTGAYPNYPAPDQYYPSSDVIGRKRKSQPSHVAPGREEKRGMLGYNYALHVGGYDRV